MNHHNSDEMPHSSGQGSSLLLVAMLRLSSIPKITDVPGVSMILGVLYSNSKLNVSIVTTLLVVLVTSTRKIKNTVSASDSEPMVVVLFDRRAIAHV